MAKVLPLLLEGPVFAVFRHLHEQKKIEEVVAQARALLSSQIEEQWPRRLILELTLYPGRIDINFVESLQRRH